VRTVTTEVELDVELGQGTRKSRVSSSNSVEKWPPPLRSLFDTGLMAIAEGPPSPLKAAPEQTVLSPQHQEKSVVLGWNGQPSDSASSGPKGPLSSFGSAEVLVTGSMRSKLALELKRQLTEEKSMAGGGSSAANLAACTAGASSSSAAVQHGVGSEGSSCNTCPARMGHQLSTALQDELQHRMEGGGLPATTDATGVATQAGRTSPPLHTSTVLAAAGPAAEGVAAGDALDTYFDNIPTLLGTQPDKEHQRRRSMDQGVREGEEDPALEQVKQVPPSLSSDSLADINESSYSMPATLGRSMQRKLQQRLASATSQNSHQKPPLLPPRASTRGPSEIQGKAGAAASSWRVYVACRSPLPCLQLL
jgi:hypothetical protein